MGQLEKGQNTCSGNMGGQERKEQKEEAFEEITEANFSK